MFPCDSRVVCEVPDGYVDNDHDCDDSNSDVNPDATEVCNGIDDDCDTVTDEADAADASTWFGDADGDGFGNAANTTVSCDAPSAVVVKYL